MTEVGNVRSTLLQTAPLNLHVSGKQSNSAPKENTCPGRNTVLLQNWITMITLPFHGSGMNNHTTSHNHALKTIIPGAGHHHVLLLLRHRHRPRRHRGRRLRLLRPHRRGRRARHGGRPANLEAGAAHGAELLRRLVAEECEAHGWPQSAVRWRGRGEEVGLCEN